MPRYGKGRKGYGKGKAKGKGKGKFFEKKPPAALVNVAHVRLTTS